MLWKDQEKDRLLNAPTNNRPAGSDEGFIVSEVQRFNCASIKGMACMMPRENGVFVQSIDYDAAQAELAALREELDNSRLANTQRIERCAAFEDELQGRLAAAEQRNADLIELLDSVFFRLEVFIDADREMPVPSMEVLRDAILRHCPTPKPTESGASE